MPIVSTAGMEAQNWEHLLDSMEEERCILCIGPEAYASEQSHASQLADFLHEKAEVTRIRVYDDGWFHFLPDASEIDAWQQIKEFYRQPPAPAIAENLRIISQLPFHFILNFTPDYHLSTIFKEQDFAYNFLSYQKKQPYDKNLEANRHKPTQLKPLILNMQGEINRRNSLVMTYNDFYSYLESVFEDGSLSPMLKENIWEADYFIFLGMPFDKWYVHLFMRILHQHEKNRSTKKYAANFFIDDEVSTQCSEQYTMTFVPTGIDEFLQAFFEKAKARGMLRSTAETAKLTLPFDQLEGWLRDNDFEKLFDHLILQLKEMGTLGTEWKTEILHMESRYNDLKRNIRMGVLDERDRVIEMNRIRANALDALKGMRKQFEPAS